MRVRLSVLLGAVGMLATTAAEADSDNERQSVPADSAQCTPCDSETTGLDDYERHAQACANGRAGSCAWQAQALFGSPWCCISGVPQDRVRSVLLFERACDLGHQEPCVDLHNTTFYAGRYGSDLAELACEQGSAHGCYAYGHGMLSRWIGSVDKVTPSGLRAATARASPWFGAACESGHSEGCFNMGLLWAHGAPGRKPDHAKAFKAFERGCKAHRGGPERPLISTGMSCVMLADAHRAGLGTEKNLRVGRQLLHQACELDGLECDQLSLLASLGLNPYYFWAVEAVLGLASNLIALVLLCSRGARTWLGTWFGRLTTTIFLASLILALCVGGQLWYYFHGGSRESALWPLVGIAVIVMPAWLLRTSIDHMRHPRWPWRFSQEGRQNR